VHCAHRPAYSDLPPCVCVWAGESCLKKTARGVDGAVIAAHNLLTDRLQPALTMLGFMLGELRGLAGVEPWSSALGLQVCVWGGWGRGAGRRGAWGSKSEGREA
jgi:hypothetical protein